MIDFLVIGGGIAGLSLGARLAKLGSVTVLEAETAIGYHASGRSAAMFEETYGQPATIALNRASKSYHMTAHGGVLSPRGLMLIGTREDTELYDHDFQTMKMTSITLEEARQIVPILDLGAITRVAHHEEAWDIDTDLLMQNFHRELRTNGARVQVKARVTQIESGSHWRVTAGDETFEARLLINAAGAWADDVARMAGVTPLGITPYRRSMARIPAPGDHDVRAWPMIFGAGERWYAKPDAGSLLVSPADEDATTPHDAWADEMVLAEGLARYEAVVSEPVTRLQSSLAGLRSFAPDRNLVIGFDPLNPAFFWQAGQGGYGMQTSPAASKLGADLIAGRAPEIEPNAVSALSPARFR